ncbi:MAG: hypothetical protein H0X59_04135 [Chloroflexi bacterium]|nr:hypothetical protein [Chloroflexota bacterium]
MRFVPAARLVSSMRSVPALRCLVLTVVLVACTGSGDAPAGATIGDTLDVSGRQRVTLLEAEVSLGGAESRPPPDGHVYASFLFRIESLTPDARYDRFRFSAVDPAGDQYAYTAGGRQPALESDRFRRTGEAVEGWVSFEIPEDFQSLAVRYEPAIAAAGEPITFVVRAPDPAQEPPR